MRSLKEVQEFGKIDADSDELLRDAFEDHPAYTEALEGRRFLIAGRKGSGKTAIFRRLITQRAFDHFAFGHTFDDYPWHYHDRQAQAGVPEERRYIHSWKYLITMSIAKILLNQDMSQPWSEKASPHLELLEDFVVDSYGSRDPDITQIFSPGKQLHFRGGVNIWKFSIQGERLPVEFLPQHFQEVNRVASEAAVEATNPAHKYYVCFDQLDLGFTLSHPEYWQRLTGLLIAAREINALAADHGKRVHVIVFLRDDIYEVLSFEDKNKVTQNSTSWLSWRQAGQDQTLKSLMERRFEVVLEEESIGWDDVFDETKQMPSRQTKYQHICDRTFMRPRDIIKFCNEALEQLKNRNPNDNRIRNEDLHEARENYSDYLLKELDDEIHKHVPDYRNYLEVVKTIGGTEFSKARFERVFTARYPDGTVTDVLRQLFEFSVVGYRKSGGRGGGSTYVWKYLDPQSQFSEVADTFRVHAGFKEALDLVRGAR